MRPVSAPSEIQQRATIEDSMKKTIHTRLIGYALALSALINLSLVLSQFAGLERDKYAWFVRVADAIAAPPGVIAKAFFEPRQHTVHAFALAAAESLLCSFVFYSFFLWLIFELLAAWRVSSKSVA
jgi:hypothetical protein